MHPRKRSLTAHATDGDVVCMSGCHFGNTHTGRRRPGGRRASPGGGLPVRQLFDDIFGHVQERDITRVRQDLQVTEQPLFCEGTKGLPVVTAAGRKILLPEQGPVSDLRVTSIPFFPEPR